MREEPTTLAEGAMPSVSIDLYQDGNGHWFASVEIARPGGTGFFSTPTFTSPKEALDQAWQDVMRDRARHNQA